MVDEQAQEKPEEVKKAKKPRSRSTGARKKVKKQGENIKTAPSVEPPKEVQHIEPVQTPMVPIMTPMPPSPPRSPSRRRKDDSPFISKGKRRSLRGSESSLAKRIRERSS